MKRIILLFILYSILFAGIVSASYDNPTIWWKFDGNNLDSKGRMNFTAGGTYVDGKVGQGLLLQPAECITTPNTEYNAFGTGNFTVAFWFKANKLDKRTVYGPVDSWLGIGQWGLYYINPDGSSIGKSIAFGTYAEGFYPPETPVTLNEWNSFVYVREGLGDNQFKIYINGVKVYENKSISNINSNTGTIYLCGGNTYHNSANISFDDFRIYKGYAFSAEDVTNFNLGLSINLISPEDNYITLPSVIEFNASLFSNYLFNITNATLYIWNSTSIYNITTNNLSGKSNSTKWNVSIDKKGNYQWNVLGCFENATYSICEFAPQNKTLQIGAQISSVVYNLSLIHI